jgi:proline dehydrogenase
LTTLKHDLHLAEKGNYIFAAKLVRGAYMEQERRLAEEQGYEDPINSNVEATTRMYHACFDEVLASLKRRPVNQVRVMIASHNEETMRYAIDKSVSIDHRSVFIDETILEWQNNKSLVVLR